MDTVYGTKKYFQSLSGASDIYRSPTVAACRTMTNDFSYQNTLGRRSTLGAYYHMNKQPSYTNDHSVNSQYGYSTWGIWRDGRNMAPSTYSVKPYHHYQKTKSFSIILTTAAFIVLLAVITIAGLAFYFSSIKTGSEEPVIGFEGSFRIAKGDLFSTGLKFNHTSSYKQKVEFYKRFVERALTDTGLHPLRTDIWGFGDGPLIRVFFRTFLDVRKLPQNIHSVEDYIKEAFILQTTSFKSLYRSLKIDNDSVDIKRILDEQIVKSASIYKDMHGTPTSQTQLEKRLLKKGGTAISSPKAASNVNKPRIKPHSVDDEPDVDVENAPVIQGSFEGSFEITKTDADIARRRTTPTRQQHTTYSSSLPPKTVTPYSLRVKPRKPGVEKLTTIIPQSLATATTAAKTTTTLTIKPVAVSTSTTTGKPATKLTTPTTTTTSTSPTTITATAATTTTTKATTTTTTKATTTTKTTTTTKPTTTTTPKAPTTPTTTVKSIKSSPPTSTLLTFDTTNYASNDYFTYPSLTSTTAAPLNILQMDTNLFTSIPVLDTQPWKPIHREVPEFLPGPPPTFPTKSLISTTAINNLPPQRRHDEMELPSLPDEPQPPKVSLYDTYSNSYVEGNLRKSQLGKPTVQDLMFYHSYGNPIFMDGTQGIERLGVGASIQPHPLPVPLIDEVVVPPFKPLNADVKSSEGVPFGIDESDEKFEHLGDGVIAKRQENISSLTLTTTPATTLKVFKVNGQKSTTITPLTTSTKALPVTKESVMKDIKLTTTEKSVVGDVLKAVSPSTELAESIGQFFMGLLNLTAEESIKNNKSLGQSLEGRIEPEEAVLEESDNNFQTNSSMEYKLQATPTTNKPSFLNIKELILKRNQEKEVEEMQQQQEREQQEQQVTQSTPVLKLQTTAQTTRLANTTPSTLNTTEKPLITTPTITTTTTTTYRTTTKRIRIKPTYNTSTILDDSNLFPSHTKWEFVNSSALNDYGHNGNMRKIFNNTLQAWVSVDVDKSENLTLNVIKNKINNATNIQDISLIFDTLASKLGITPSIPAKEPPFSHNKLMQTLKNETPTKMNNLSTNLIPKRTAATTTTKTTTTTTTTTVTPPPTTTTTTTTTITRTTSPKPRSTPSEKSTTSTSTLRYEEVFYKEKREPDYVQPFMGYGEDTSSEGIGAAIPVVGEAEVEVIDPTKYEEMLLKSSQFAESPTTEIMPKLVTLLPVRSNSGIRTYKPPNTSDSSRSSTEDLITRKPTHSTNHRSSNRKTHNGQERRFPPSETVIRGGFIVKSHYD